MDQRGFQLIQAKFGMDHHGLNFIVELHIIQHLEFQVVDLNRVLLKYHCWQMEEHI